MLKSVVASFFELVAKILEWIRYGKTMENLTTKPREFAAMEQAKQQKQKRDEKG